MTAPSGLTVNDRIDPLGVEGTPLFGWLPGEQQTGYQIRVHRPGGDLIWDSGEVLSERAAFVPYAGPELAAGTTYTWRVRTLQSPWSADAVFDTGVGEWQAAWIRRTTAEKDDYTQARTEFRVGEVTRARLYLSASQQYRAYLNGRLVDRGPAFAYPGEGYYQVTDVTEALRAGDRNALGVLYHWYGPGQGRPEGEPGLIARLVIDGENGERQVVVSDGSWRVARGPWLEAEWRNDDGRDYIEHIDGRRQSNWSEPGFDDTGWQRAEEAGAPRLRAQLTRLRYTEVEPVSVTTLPSGAVVADFGVVIPAVPRVRFRDGADGRLVEMVAGYVLDAAGNVSNSLHDNQVTDLSFSYVQADGDQTFEAFTYVGFRYLQVSLAGDISAVVQHADADPARSATFRSSDATLDAVFALLQRSALYSTQEQFLDTPTREKGQFLADAVTISRALMAVWGDRAVTARAIREIAASQARYWPDGRLNAVYPNGDGKRDIPDFTAMFPGWVRDYHLASGDEATVTEVYPVCVAVADYVRRYRDENTGLVTRLAGGGGAYEYGIVDWPNRYGYDTAVAARTTVNILAVDALRATAFLAAEIGRPQAEIDALAADADTLTAAINDQLRRPDGIYLDGLFLDGRGSTHASQIANAYAIAHGVAPPETHKTIADHLASLKLRMGPMVADTLLTALHRAGRDDEVLARLTDASALGWATILARGGTFTWESWEAPETGESLSHGWGSAALVPLLQSLLGVTVTAPAARRLRIAPPVGTGLTHAAGTLWTQSGPVAVEWATGSLIVDLPANVTADVHVPGGLHRAGPGRSSFTW